MGKRSLVLLLSAAALGLAAGTAGPALGASNVTATQAYIRADYALVRVAQAHLKSSEAAPLTVLAQVRRECPLAGAGSPQDPESTQLSDEVIGAMVIAAAQPDIQAIKAFVKAVAGLSWSNGALTGAVRRYTSNLKTILTLGAPNLCGDVRAWVASGFHALAASTAAFVGRFMPAWVALGYVPGQLSAYESSAASALARRASGLEQQLTDGEARAVEHWGEIMNALLLNP